MSPEQRRYLFVECTIGAAVVNALLNGAIGWGITRGLATFPVWKARGVATDLLATAFGVAFGTCFGAVLQVRIDTARGKITVPTALPPRLSILVSRLPRGVIRRGLALGVVSTVALAPLIILGLVLS